MDIKKTCIVLVYLISYLFELYEVEESPLLRGQVYLKSMCEYV